MITQARSDTEQMVRRRLALLRATHERRDLRSDWMIARHEEWLDGLRAPVPPVPVLKGA